MCLQCSKLLHILLINIIIYNSSYAFLVLFSVFQHGHFCINNSYMYMMERESWPHVLLLLCFMFIIMSNACHCFMLCFNYMLLIVGQKLLKACVVLLLTCRLKINIYLIYLSYLRVLANALM